MDKCRLNNLRVDCEGRITPDNLCMAHSILFDFWGCECEGYFQYDKHPRHKARRMFRDWIKGLTDRDIYIIKNH